MEAEQHQPILDRIWPQLLPELAEHIASFLSCNEIACTLRLVNKAAAQQFRRPQHTTVRLSEPVPPHAFAQHWAAPGAVRGMSLRQRRRLLSLTAASGVVPNMEVALEAAGCLPESAALDAAAAAGQLGMCQWLAHLGDVYSLGSGVEAAAQAGRREVVLVLLSISSFDSERSEAAIAAARGGHVALMDELVGDRREEFRRNRGRTCGLLHAASHGFDLPTLQRLHREWLEEPLQGGGGGGQQQPQLDPQVVKWVQASTMEAAAGSPTPDWQAKVGWLQGLGVPLTAPASRTAAERPDAVSRLSWLRQRGCPADRSSAETAVRTGNLAALKYLHSELVPLDCSTVLDAARQGHLSVVAWLLDVLPGVQEQVGARMFNDAAFSGNLELLLWLHERGYLWDNDTFRNAACGGNDEMLEWLVESGCPMMGGDGELYNEAAIKGDLATLQCLWRLGCPWGPPGAVFTNAVEDGVSLSVLRWLLDAGCPVRWQEAEAAAHDYQSECIYGNQMIAFLGEQRQRRAGGQQQ